MHFVGILQSLGLYFVVLLATAALLSLAMAGLAQMERATIPLDRPRRPVRHGSAITDAPRTSTTARLSSPGSCTYGPRGR